MKLNKKQRYYLGYIALIITLMIVIFSYRHFANQKPTPTLSTVSVREKTPSVHTVSKIPAPSTQHPQFITRRKSSATTHHSKPFAYELANALETDTPTISNAMNSYYSAKVLRNARETTKDTAIYKALIHRLQADHSYDDLVKLLTENTPLRDIKTPQLYLKSLRETKAIDTTRPQTVQVMKDALQKLQTTKAISPQDSVQHQLLIDARTGTLDGLSNNLASITDQSLRDDLRRVLDYYKKQKDVPMYYRDALIAMVLAQHEYFSLAEKIATRISLKNPDYLLPLQILAYSAFSKSKRDVADEYFKQLIIRDEDQTDFYHFLQGIVAYQKGKYDDAVLLFNQVKDPYYMADISRYLILAYDRLGEYDRRDSLFASLLQYKLEPSDYYTYFYLTLFRPFQQGKRESDTPPKLNLKTMQDYVTSCAHTLKEDTYVICQYGAAGGLFVSGKLEQASQALFRIYEQYPLGYIARAIGDYYMSQGAKADAMSYYYRAFRDASSPLEQSITQQKIRKIGQEAKK